MKNLTLLAILLLVLGSSLTACVKVPASPDGAIITPGSGVVTGKVTDAQGNALAGVKIIIEHTVWHATYVFAVTDDKGYYKAELPTLPTGSWTAKAQLERSAYGKNYLFDLAPDRTVPFTRDSSVVRNMVWKLSGPRPDDPRYWYGAHVDLYQLGTDVPLDKVKLVFTPSGSDDKFIDGSPVVLFERSIENVGGTFMAKDVPIGKYSVKAVYAGKTLLLDNQHDGGAPQITKTVVFAKNGYLGQTEYNIEFWLTE